MVLVFFKVLAIVLVVSRTSLFFNISKRSLTPTLLYFANFPVSLQYRKELILTIKL
jgi:hypothetical protein